MKKILLASVAALGLAGTASAAELAVAPAPLPVPIFTWTGCYLGINGGWIGGNDDYTTRRTGTSTNPYNFNGAEQAPERVRGVAYLLSHSFSSDESAGTFGGQFGCQYQAGWFVLGGEWDANWSGLKEDNYFNYGPVPIPGTISYWRPRNELSHKQLDWFTTARVRVGAAWWDRVLLYATGGIAMGAFDAYQQVAFVTPNDPFGIPDYFGAYRENRIGWTVGGGFEWAFAANWTAKAEFLYLDFGSFDYISPRVNFDPTTRTLVWNTSIDAKEYVARVGINYLFHLGPPAVAPVYARY
jgi:outer membrane immunogenic protein